MSILAVLSGFEEEKGSLVIDLRLFFDNFYSVAIRYCFFFILYLLKFIVGKNKQTATGIICLVSTKNVKEFEKRKG